MKLSPEEETFLRHWMYDEVHYKDGVGPAKSLQVQHSVAPSDFATLIAATIPDPQVQREAGASPSHKLASGLAVVVGTSTPKPSRTSTRVIAEPTTSQVAVK